MDPLIENLFSLGIGLLIAWFVWLYYRKKTVTVDERYSTFGPRFWTGSVDNTVLLPVGILASVPLLLDLPPVILALIYVVQSIVWLLYTVAMHAWYGQTIGKMITKVRVVDFETEGPISWKQAWLREGIPAVLSLGLLMWHIVRIMNAETVASAQAEEMRSPFGTELLIVAAIPFLWFIAEIITMLTNEKRRALHDFIAGTVVVRTNVTENEDLVGARPSDVGASF